MEKQLIDDIRQIVLESTYFVAYVQATEKTPTAFEMMGWKNLAICMYIDNPRFQNLVNKQTVLIMNKIEEHVKKSDLSFGEIMKRCGYRQISLKERCG